MSQSSNTVDKSTFNKLSRLYIIALSAIALSIIISQVFVRNHLKSQQSDSTVINVAGRQRMLSQKLTKEVISLNETVDANERIDLKDKIKGTLLLWHTSHIALQKGSKTLGLPGNNSKIISEMFIGLNDTFSTIYFNANEIINAIEQNPNVGLYKIKRSINVVKENENSFLLVMDNIVNQYNAEADEKTKWLRKLEFFLAIFTLLILLGEFLFIFWPTAKTIRATLSELLFAERKAKKMAADADQLNIEKEKSIKELRALNHAMDEALLFARTTPDGEIIHLGKKFSQLFNYSKINNVLNFAEVVSIDEKEQALIENILVDYRKTGWQGEVKGTSPNKKTIWLEMTVIPFNLTGDRSELLIIASDISSRKAAQLEIEHLRHLSFEEKMSQQKIISSKIIENQEKEQNRIAKDVHDGIGQMLTGLKFNLESINCNDIEKTSAKVKDLKELTANIIKGVRTATFNLTPPELSDYGIVPAITKLTQELSRLTGKEILFFNKTDFNGRLDTLVEINIYRIVQEAINNAIKYADSQHILVIFSHSEKILSIMIDDDGKGFDPKKVKKIKKGDGGMGMTFMRERISYIEGRLFLNSEIGKGTRVTLNIPINK